MDQRLLWSFRGPNEKAKEKAGEVEVEKEGGEAEVEAEVDHVLVEAEEDPDLEAVPPDDLYIQEFLQEDLLGDLNGDVGWKACPEKLVGKI